LPLLFAPLAVCLAALTRQTGESLASREKSVQDVSRVEKTNARLAGKKGVLRLLLFGVNSRKVH
jgi:hypothetical protein